MDPRIPKKTTIGIVQDFKIRSEIPFPKTIVVSA